MAVWRPSGHGMLSPEGAQDSGYWGRGSLKAEPSCRACVCLVVLASLLQSVLVYLLVLTVETGFLIPTVDSWADPEAGRKDW